MIIYHGSKDIIEKPEFGKGNKKNDYGLGFYCTENVELAKEWACSNNETNGYANQYEIDLTDYRILDLREEKYSILNWMALLLKFRTFDVNTPISAQAKEYILENFYVDVGEYDVIIGYRADDSYFSFAKDFINNTISVEQLAEAMRLGELGIQIVLKSEKAFDTVKFISYELAECKEYYVKRVSSDKKARETYLNGHRQNLVFDGLFVMDIIRKGLKNGDKIL
ncbi:MAG TPA: DUF3990 domain-containing protein [Candidatus Limihabitans stercoravium]|nr:DUF3990 domain-containing protein [Candidatus Limihabitans stercoravium]